MQAALLSDVHVRSLDGPAQRRFVSFARSLEAEQLFILGDLFHAWWGFEEVVDAEVVPTLVALHELRQRGVEVTFIPGNHDFAVGRFLPTRVGVRVRERWEGELAGRRALLVHGDEADATLGYRLARRILRGRGFAASLRALGPARAQRLLRRLAGGSRALGDGVGGPALRSAQHAWAERAHASGYELVVMGHSHQPEVLRGPMGVFVNLGSFSHHGTWLEVDGGTLRLHGI